MTRAIAYSAFFIFLCSAAITVTAQPFRDSFNAVTRENFDLGGAISRQFHLNAESYLHTATIARTGVARELPRADRPDVRNFVVRHSGGQDAFAEFVAGSPVIDGVIVLHRGRVVFEAYPHMADWQRHFAWSVTKVFTATTLAVLAERGQVDMQAPVDRYVPLLKTSAWAGITIQHIADMASGIDCLDADGYQNTSSCIYALEESLGITAPTGRNPDFIEHLQGMQMHRESGLTNEYVSANTAVLMLVIESIMQQPYTRAVQSLVWDPIGAEADALMAISQHGYAYAAGGLQARLRDVARFGQVFVQPEMLEVVSEATLDRMRSGGVPLSKGELDSLRDDFGDDLPARASWQWDYVWDDGAMFKSGYSDQGLYVDVQRELVVAWFGTEIDVDAGSYGMLPVTRQMVRAGLFSVPGG